MRLDWLLGVALALLVQGGVFSGCATTIAAGAGSEGEFPVTDDNPQHLEWLDLNPPGTPGASAPPW